MVTFVTPRDMTGKLPVVDFHSYMQHGESNLRFLGDMESVVTSFTIGIYCVNKCIYEHQFFINELLRAGKELDIDLRRNFLDMRLKDTSTPMRFNFHESESPYFQTIARMHNKVPTFIYEVFTGDKGHEIASKIGQRCVVFSSLFLPDNHRERRLLEIKVYQ